MLCPRGNDSASRAATVNAFPLGSPCGLNPQGNTFDTATYKYIPGWPLPPVPEDPLPTTPETTPSDFDSSTSGSGDAPVDSVEVGGSESLDEDTARSPRSKRPTSTKLDVSTPKASSLSDDSQDALSATTTIARGPATPTPLYRQQGSVAPQQVGSDLPTDRTTIVLRSNGQYVQIVGALAFCALVVIAVVIIYVKRRRSSAFGKTSGSSFAVSSYSTLDSPFADTNDRFASAAGLGKSENGAMVTIKKVFTIDQIHDIRLIGSGGYAVVYLVRDKLSNRLLASKRFVQNHFTNDMIDQFFHEIRTVSLLEYPCVVTFVGATWTNRHDVQALLVAN